VKEALTADVKIACVAGGFPSSQTFNEIKIAETSLAVADGADEIDVVINVGKFLEGEYEEMCEELTEIKEACRHASLKVILETGALQNVKNIHNAAILALYSGADFLKTSTEKDIPGFPEAAYVICQAILSYHAKTGRKSA
jgi:deoxyribose-phosphate aldolase